MAKFEYENFNGSDCTGGNKLQNRTLTVVHEVGLIILERKVLHPVDDYSVSGKVITFLLRIDNRYRITIFR